jgi:hypothetical protein
MSKLLDESGTIIALSPCSSPRSRVPPLELHERFRPMTSAPQWAVGGSMEVKYLVVPGFVISENRERRFIDARQLIQLYGVDPRECAIASPMSMRPVPRHDLILLRPLVNGNYQLPA